MPGMGATASPREEAATGVPTLEEELNVGTVTADGGTLVHAEGCGDSDLKRLVRLLTNEDTAELSDRQLVVLRRVCKVRQRGFRYGELALVEKLLPLLESRVALGQVNEFRAPLLKFLDICSLAPVRDRANEEFTERGLTASSSLFRVLGGTLSSPDGGIQAATADVLRKIAAGNDPTRPSTPDDEGKSMFGECRHDLRPKSRDINQALLLGCGVVTLAVGCLGIMMDAVMKNLAELDDASFQSSSFDDSKQVNQAETDSLGVVSDVVRQAAEPEGGVAAGGEVVLDGHVSATGVRDEGLPVIQFDCEGAASDVALNYTALVSLLQLVRELSTDAASSAAMVEAGLVSLLVQVMQAVRGVRDPTLSITVEVMWNCLEHSQNAMAHGLAAESRTELIRKARKSNAAFALSTWDGVSALRDMVEALLIGGFRKKDKELRNEAVIVASQLARNGRSHPLFRTTGMLQLLLRYATAIETGLADGDPRAAESEARTFVLAGDEASNGGGGVEQREVPELEALADPRNFATTTEVDMELKQLLWSLLADVCKRDVRNLEVVKASPLIETLLMYMDLVIEEGPNADTSRPGVSRSVSLASMPSLGSGQSTPAACVTTSTAATGEEQSSRKQSVASAACTDPPPAVPLSASVPNSDDFPVLCLDGGRGDSKANELESAGHVADVTLTASAREASPVMGGAGADTFTQLYVPATVVRLPVTLIQLLQGQAMASLLVLAPRCPRKFQALGGHMVTLRLLDRLGSRPENQRLVKVATKMLATVVGLPGLKEELGRMDGVRIMLDRFSDEWKQEPQGAGGAGSGDVDGSRGSGGSEGADDLRTDTVIILCRLCDGCKQNQEAFRKADGIPTMMTAVKAYCRSRSEAKQQEEACSAGGGGSGGGGSGASLLALGGSAGRLDSGSSSGESLDASLVHIVDCVWCAVVGNRRSEARLLQCEGLDTLLDLLELCPVFTRHQVTGVIADLLCNKRSIPYARAWRSDLNMLSITQLMMRMWVEEEARLGVSRPNGILQNLWQPLQSHDRRPGRRCRNAGTARRSESGRPTSATSPDPTNRTSSDDVTSAVRRSRSKSCGFELGRPPESVAGVMTHSVLTGLPREISEIRETCGTAGGAQDVRTAPSAIALALQVGKRAAATGQRTGGRQSKRASQVGAEGLVAKAMRNLDLRGKIAAVLELVGFDGRATDGLGPSDLKASYMATNYMAFREGEAWQEVAGELEAQQVNPIAADALVLDTMLEQAFDCAHEVKSKQMALTVEQGRRDGETEEAFFADILFQRDQEIRQAIIKRNALVPGTSKKRLAAKKAKENMLKRSGTRSSGGSSDTGAGSGQRAPEEDLEEDADVNVEGGRGSTAVAG